LDTVVAANVIPGIPMRGYRIRPSNGLEFLHDIINGVAENRKSTFNIGLNIGN
jgi:hypothetical protein